ncbi:mechanosensitive ion channel family protein [Pleurocapsales cyanobacterium LEGE 06147]|nr:mechanosensitive ion channel family protein [Pleurocapsales cyanobacterium LEGE 06147]
MTVTQSDVVLDRTPNEQAQIWAEQIRQAVQRAQAERSSEFLWQSLLLLGIVVILAIAFHWGLGWLWRNSLGETTKLLTSERAPPDFQLHTLNLSLKLRLQLARITLWLTVLIYAINLFPFTRQWSYRLSNGLIVGLTFPLLFILFSLIAGQYTPFLVRLIISRLFPQKGKDIYQNLVEPNTNLLIIASTLILISFCLVWIEEYEVVYNFFRFFLDLGTIASLAWLSSRLFRRLVRVYGIDVINKLGREVDELLLVFETLANVIIGFIAVVAFAQSRFDLVGLLAGLGIGGLAIAFAAQKTLEQLLGTLVLYLDRPFVAGEYIRLRSSQQFPEELFGRVESIGLRSTKIRTLAKSTLVIVPNSFLANLEIENVSRGKKVMVLLYLDFAKSLAQREQALVEQVVQESTNTLFGIDPGSTKISFFQPEDKLGTRARVSFFILGSSQDSIALRKRLLELANEKISKKLTNHGIEFTMQEPTVYVESPMTI